MEIWLKLLIYSTGWSTQFSEGLKHWPYRVKLCSCQVVKNTTLPILTYIYWIEYIPKSSFYVCDIFPVKCMSTMSALKHIAFLISVYYMVQHGECVLDHVMIFYQIWPYAGGMQKNIHFNVFFKYIKETNLAIMTCIRLTHPSFWSFVEDDYTWYLHKVFLNTLRKQI